MSNTQTKYVPPGMRKISHKPSSQQIKINMNDFPPISTTDHNYQEKTNSNKISEAWSTNNNQLKKKKDVKKPINRTITDQQLKMYPTLLTLHRKKTVLDNSSSESQEIIDELNDDYEDNMWDDLQNQDNFADDEYEN